MGICQITVPRDSEGSDGKRVSDFITPPDGLWTPGYLETDFPPDIWEEKNPFIPQL
jgi:hypothetical protein